jgi:carboxymethylenebutenolidase
MEIIGNSAKPDGLVLVVHSWWGLTQSFRDFAEGLAKEGFAAGLSDLFDGKTATDPEMAQRLRRAPRRVPMYKTLIANINELRACDQGAARPVAVVGFSMGGHWAIWLSQQKELPIRSTVIYYAARAGSFTDSRSAFLAHFADDDPWVSRASRRRMETEIAKAKRPYIAHDYAGAKHWFAETVQTETYDRRAAKLAFERTVAHLRATIM